MLAKTAWGQAFSDSSVTLEQRLTKINDLDDDLRALRRSIMNAAAAKTAADGLTMTNPSQTEFEGNGTETPPSNGINYDVQVAAEALWETIDTLT